MTASPIPDGLRAIAREAAIEAWGPRVGAPGSAYLGKVADAVLAAVYPLLRAQVREEVARDIEAAALQRQISASVLFGATDRGVEDMVWSARIARGVAADGACSRGGPLPTK